MKSEKPLAATPVEAIVRLPLPRDGQTIAVWFSCGAASAVAAKRTVERYGDRCNVRVINNPVAEEHEDNQRFLRDVEQWIGVEVETAVNKNFPSCSAVEVWAKQKYMSGIAGAPCTYELKKQARQQWEAKNKADWCVLGFTFDEQARAERFAKTERSNLLPILVSERITKADCFRILFAADIEIPMIYKLGYPNANCIGCCKATSPTYWNHVRSVHPEIFEQRATQSREIGARLVRVNGERMFLDELPEDATGNAMDGLNFECGSFCEERPLF
jgi:hypothetical protein